MSSVKIQPILERFKLTYPSRKRLRTKEPKFGFNGLGEVVFRRTYSRDNESWNDVVIRVIEGTMSIRKEHFIRNSLHWNDVEWQSFAHSMAKSLFDMEWMPPGRGLWMMGTDFTYTRGSTALNNCGATDTVYDIVHSAEWTMDLLMNGVGIGFSTNWRGTATAPDKSNPEIYVIPDSREGWVESLIKLMCSYIDSPRHGHNKYQQFDYSTIRAPGVKIKGFGGTSSGLEPLKKMHIRIESYLDAFCQGKLECKAKTWQEIKNTTPSETPSEWREVEVDVCKPYGHTRLIADIFNAIGACVVAGNVRRCLPGDSLVHTSRGLVPIKDVTVGTKVLTMDGYHDVTNVFEQGDQQLIRIVTQDGDFRCTSKHRMAVCSGYDTYIWKEAGTLLEGDRLVSPRYQISGYNTSLPTCKDIIVPPLDCDISWLIGVFHGNGYANGDNAYISVVGGLTEYDTMVEVQKQLQRFGTNLLVTFEKRNNENSYIVRCQSKQLAWYFDSYIKHIQIPEYILRAHTDIKLAYVAGVTDADGCLVNIPVNVVATIYEQFARDLQVLLYSCGIESRLDICTVDYRLNRLNLITKHSQTLFDSIPQLHKVMNQTSRSQNANGFPCEYETDSKIKTKFGLYNNKQFNLDEYDRHYGCSDIVPVSVIRLEDDKVEKTYDIEVENRHEFICNGYLTHNSAEISLGDATDTDFINLKNYELNPERSEIGWMSNNSVVLSADKDYEDFSYIPEMARRIRDNGEPGMINLYNIQKYGRYGKELPDKANLVNPCGEIALENFELCNLAEVFPPRCKNIDVYYNALRFATFYASTVSLLPTHRAETNAVVARNRRIGVSISGVAQWASGEVNAEWGEMNYTKMTKFLREGYKVVKSKNIELAESAGIPASIRVTTVKPSGSISLLAGVTAGVHYPVSRYAIRRMRIGADSPLVDSLKESGIPYEKDTYSDNTLVFSFAIDHGNVRSAEEVSPWEQFSLVATMQRCYADNCVSATIYFDKEKDGPDVEKMLAMYIPILKSVSMLPHAGHGYVQAPYEPITRERYLELKDSYSIPDFSGMSGNVPEGSRFCSGDTCEL